MPATIHVTHDADEATAAPGIISLEELAANVALEDSSIETIEAVVLGLLSSLPTEDPLEDGQFWLNSGVLTMSSGS